MVEFYHALEALNPNCRNLAVTVLSGEAFGEKALFSERKIVWESREQGFFRTHEQEIAQTEDSGIVICAGQELFCECLGAEKKLVICGGGHVSIPVIQMGRMIGFHVTVLEDRPLFADHARRAGASEVFCEPFEEGLKRITGDEDTFFVIVTRGHRYDQVCLERIAKKRHAYIGMIGSKRRVRMVKETLIAQGADPDVIEKIYSPIGLDIGAETPEEIAIAIMAEIIEVKSRQKRANGYPQELLREICGSHAQEEAAAEDPGERKVLATIVRRRGSAPRKAGTKMLILPDGRCVGTIGGGCAESEICSRALAMIRSGVCEPKLCRVDMTGDEAEEEGMVCGGVIDVLLEVI